MGHDRFGRWRLLGLFFPQSRLIKLLPVPCPTAGRTMEIVGGGFVTSARLGTAATSSGV